MKKQLLLAAFLMGSFFTANAQTTLLSNNFGTDNATLNEQLEGWIGGEFDTDGDEFTYYLDEDFQALGFAGIVTASATFIPASDAPDAELVPTSPNNYLLSPLVDLSTYANSTLTFKAANFGGQGSSMDYEILVLTEAQYNDENFDLNTLAPIASAALTPGAARTITVDLSSYSKQKIYILFIHTSRSTGLGYLILDDILVTGSGVAGIENILASKFSVFPNPSNGVVTVANTNALINAIAVTDINGRTVKNVKVGGVASTEVNISDLASGVYMMSISSDKGTSTQKIVKN